MAKQARPGRPAQDKAKDACDSIVSSACVHFARHGIKGSSNRQIATDAKVTPALVHYYFKRKQDLHQAVLQRAFDPLMAAVREVTTLDEWVRVFHAHLSRNPWLPHLMIREVLSQNGQLRAIFLQQFAPHIFGFVKALVAKEAKAANAGKSFDVDRHVVLLMGMLVYPFLGLEIAHQVTGRKFDATMMDGFRDDALAMFRKGING